MQGNTGIYICRVIRVVILEVIPDCWGNARCCCMQTNRLCCLLLVVIILLTILSLCDHCS